MLDARHRASQTMRAMGVPPHRRRRTRGGPMGIRARPTMSISWWAGKPLSATPAEWSRCGCPSEVSGVVIDWLSVHSTEQHVTDALAAEPGSFAQASVLVYLKLKSPRSKDRTTIARISGVPWVNGRRLIGLGPPTDPQPRHRPSAPTQTLGPRHSDRAYIERNGNRDSKAHSTHPRV